MALFEISTGRGAAAQPPRIVESICLAVIFAEAVFSPVRTSPGCGSSPVTVAGSLRILSTSGPPDAWCSAATPATAYDWPTHKLAEDAALGHAFDGYYGWHYPPPFLFVAAALASLPYTIAFLVWTTGTFLLYLATIRTIIGDRIGYLLAAAFPPVLANFFVGQNGFLSAALFGGTLVLIERRQSILAGVLLGLLSYKPHLGLLFPIALVAAGQWRVIVTAGIVASLMALASWLAFGSEGWLAFFGNIGQSSQAVFTGGKADWSKLQTAFGLVRTLGGSETLAWTAQAAVTVAAALVVALVWRSRAAYEIKAAVLGTAALLATPYLYTYDLAVLAVPLAFLFRLGRTRGFLSNELTGVGIACLLILIFILPAVNIPVGLLGSSSLPR